MGAREEREFWTRRRPFLLLDRSTINCQSGIAHYCRFTRCFGTHQPATMLDKGPSKTCFAARMGRSTASLSVLWSCSWLWDLVPGRASSWFFPRGWYVAHSPRCSTRRVQPQATLSQLQSDVASEFHSITREFGGRAS